MTTCCTFINKTFNFAIYMRDTFLATRAHKAVYLVGFWSSQQPALFPSNLNIKLIKPFDLKENDGPFCWSL